MPHDLRPIPRRLGVAVRDLRTLNHLSQMKLAERADLSLNYLGSIERGEKLASVETVVKIGRALGGSGADLLRRAGL